MSTSMADLELPKVDIVVAVDAASEESDSKSVKHVASHRKSKFTTTKLELWAFYVYYIVSSRSCTH